MSSIRLHKDYGLNPTVKQCFFCGNDTNEILLLGASYKKEAPLHMVVDYEPCDSCKENMDKGVTLVEVQNFPACEDHMEISVGKYPTGKWVVITKEASDRIFGGVPGGKALVEVGVLQKLGI